MKSIGRREFLEIFGGVTLAAAMPQVARAQGAKAPLQLGIQTSVWGSVGMVADAEKTFEKAGGDVTLHKFDSGRAVRDAMVSGRIDIGSIGTAPFIVGVAKGDMVALATVAYAGRTNGVVAAKGIKSVAELKGKRVGSQIGSSTHHLFLNRVAPAFGLKKDDYQIVNTKFENHVSALASNSVDAFAGVEPYISVAELNGIGHALADYGKYDMVPVWLAANKSVVEGKREAVVTFLKGWLATVKIFKENPKHAAEVVYNFYRKLGYTFPQAAIERMLAKFDVNPDFVPDLKSYMVRESEILKETKRISAVPDWNKVLDASLLKQARA